MKTHAVLLEKPEHIALSSIDLTAPEDDDVVVDIEWSGISTGTERLLWNGRMPVFPGMGYPLVPGYEAVGRVREAGSASGLERGQRVFVPGAQCFGEIRGIFGGSAARLVVPRERVVPVAAEQGEQAVLLALAATAFHAIDANGGEPPDLIVGHGVLGRLLARLTLARGGAAPVVWECDRARAAGACGYSVVNPDDDPRHNYRSIYDVSGDASMLNTLIGRLERGGEIVLAGFYAKPLSFVFAPAFIREARIRVAAEWAPPDLTAVNSLVESGRLSLADLITHRQDAEQADQAYRTAFADPDCLKMILDWRSFS
ncbi:MAG: chlorophyll synthesis pathway protein BchC [Gammaproteobacteria bacterium]|nr:chlorophyll synthesis pathway protein BchC [Pseudomonadales bacterium]MCP5347011.1 chlorophyll synthesis pathway protein BchC [Pseudomonadales bacterium]